MAFPYELGLIIWHGNFFPHTLPSIVRAKFLGLIVVICCDISLANMYAFYQLFSLAWLVIVILVLCSYSRTFYGHSLFDFALFHRIELYYSLALQKNHIKSKRQLSISASNPFQNDANTTNYLKLNFKNLASRVVDKLYKLKLLHASIIKWRTILGQIQRLGPKMLSTWAKLFKLTYDEWVQPKPIILERFFFL